MRVSILFPTVLCQLLQAYLAQNAAEGVELKMDKGQAGHCPWLIESVCMSMYTLPGF